MLSLSNAFDKNDMEDFLKKVKNFVKKKRDINICMMVLHLDMNILVICEDALLVV